MSNRVTTVRLPWQSGRKGNVFHMTNRVPGGHCPLRECLAAPGYDKCFQNLLPSPRTLSETLQGGAHLQSRHSGDKGKF